MPFLYGIATLWCEACGVVGDWWGVVYGLPGVHGLPGEGKSLECDDAVARRIFRCGATAVLHGGSVTSAVQVFLKLSCFDVTTVSHDDLIVALGVAAPMAICLQCTSGVAQRRDCLTGGDCRADILLECDCGVSRWLDIVYRADIPADIWLLCAIDVAQRATSSRSWDYFGIYFVAVRLSRYTAT